MLALSTSCVPEGWSLDRAVASFRDLHVRAVALHRAAREEEVVPLASFARRVGIVAIFGAVPLPGESGPVLVVEGGDAGEDREASLEELCRRLHTLRDFSVALRTPEHAGRHPSPEELEWVHSSLGHVGYWHDATRGGEEFLGEEFLEAGQRLLRGASFHPLDDTDLRGIRDALPSGAPAVVACPPGTPSAEVRSALDRARGCFGA